MIDNVFCHMRNLMLLFASVLNLYSKDFANTKGALFSYRLKEKSLKKRKCFSFTVSYPVSKGKRQSRIKLMF